MQAFLGGKNRGTTKGSPLPGCLGPLRAKNEAKREIERGNALWGVLYFVALSVSAAIIMCLVLGFGRAVGVAAKIKWFYTSPVPIIYVFMHAMKGFGLFRPKLSGLKV